jgi:diguanylate cyclase (GGDEF)-like protein/PAS domain S-box-containing protein
MSLGRRAAIQSVELPRPTIREAAPFLAVAALGLGSALRRFYDGSGVELWVAIGALVVAVAFQVISARRRVRTWVDPMAPFIFFLVVALARDLTGGAASELTALLALPILWLAITGTRRDLMAASVLSAAVFLVPVLAIGPPEYPLGDWRRAVLWAAMAALVAPVVQRFVQQLAVETHNARATSAEVAGIMRGARLSSLIATDADGTIRSFSVGAEELLGYRAEQMVGCHQLGVLHDPEEVAAAAQELGVQPGFDVFAELARQGAPSRIWTYVRSDGKHIYVQLAITELRDGADVLNGYLGVAIDATSRVEAERALALSEAQWRVLSDHLPDTTLITVDEELVIRVVAGAGAMRQGIQGFEGRPLADASKPENMAILRGLIQEAFEGREASAELTSTAAGTEHEVVVTPLPRESDGARALILARDVSKERARERAVVLAKERAERLFADAPHGVAVLTTSGSVIQVNSALRALIGEVPGGLEGRTLALLSRPGDDQIDRHLADALSVRGAPVESDWTMRAADGREVHVVLSSRALRGDDGTDDVVLVNIVDVSERRRYEERLAHLADHDVLTGLANRRRFDEELIRHLDRCRRYGPTGALLLLDLDNFKDVNDTLGHGAGDQLIISTAALLQAGVRGTDVVARLGGDEFAILLTDADRASAQVVAQSIVDRIREHTATLDGTRRRVTASMGVVTIQAASEHAADILALADMTMYDAKDAGRNRIVVLDEHTHRQPRSGARLQWTGRIERALENDDFALHLQPILDLRTDTIRSAEVLLRLHDTDEYVLPSRFLYVAERAGLVPSLDTWVIKHSVAMLARLRRVVPEFRFEVNLSGHSIGDADVEAAIVESLREHDVDPSALILEITETAAVADVEAARQFADRMASLGCKFALDDFGAGFGSFYYLKHLLFDYVKIDGEFVANCHRSSIDRTILRSIVGIARDLGKQSIAEFVAERAILDVVRTEGVDLAQGYFIGEPVPYEEFLTRFLSDDAPFAAIGPSHRDGNAPEVVR